MKNFDEKEKQIQEICERVRNADFIDAELKIAYYDIIKIVRNAYYEGHDDGVKCLSEIQVNNQNLISNLFK